MRVFRSNGPRSVAEILRDASRAMDYEDQLLRLRGEYVWPMPTPRRSLLDRFRCWLTGR